MLMPRSHSIRAARSWARVCFRVGMHKPRIGFGGDAALGTTSSPVLAPSCGKKRAPSGLVVTVRPKGEVRISVPSGS